MEDNEVEQLRQFKGISGWSYMKIANLMGVAIQSIINWLQGIHEPSRMALEKIRRFLAEYSFKA